MEKTLDIWRQVLEDLVFQKDTLNDWNNAPPVELFSETMTFRYRNEWLTCTSADVLVGGLKNIWIEAVFFFLGSDIVWFSNDLFFIDSGIVFLVIPDIGYLLSYKYIM